MAIAFIILMVQGFRAGIWWGLLVFFVPLLGVVIFALARWNMAKGAFLMHIIGIVVGAGGFLGIASRSGMLEEAPVEPEQSESIPETDSSAQRLVPNNLDWTKSRV